MSGSPQMTSGAPAAVTPVLTSAAAKLVGRDEAARLARPYRCSHCHVPATIGAGRVYVNHCASCPRRAVQRFMTRMGAGR